MFERLLKIFLPVAFGVALQTLSAGALGGSVVIAQVQAGSSSGDGAATQEFISIYNNSPVAVDATNWCVSNKANVSFACLTPPSANTTLSLGSHEYALIASDTFAARFAGTYDTVFTTTNKTSGSLVGGSDTVTLLDANGAAVDSASWTTSLAGGTVLTRQWGDQSAGIMLDTDNASDFKKVTPLVVPASGVVEETHVVDYCSNIDGVQTSVPDGYQLTAAGECVIDMCPNIAGLQLAIPEKMRVTSDGTCLYDLPPLQLTELLPNAAGSDEGNEFIEIFNPNNDAVPLDYYQLQVGPNFEKTYSFNAGSTIAAHEYKAFFNSEIKYTLLNTASRVRLMTVDGQVVSETPLYNNPADDAAWAFLDDAWMFTNQPTPGLPNLLPTDDGTTADSTPATGLKACASNQYRNPETNRCRLISASVDTLKPCKDGQYRSEETNRCRSIASDATSAKPCSEDQFRNPATGRCKKIASEEEVKDCGEGRERNPTTHRCRNVVAKASGITGGGVAMVPASAASKAGWIAGGIVALIALGYAVMEWRREIKRWLWRVSAPIRRLWYRLRYNK